jgi:nucleoside-diphosphate-sugar epimerase
MAGRLVRVFSGSCMSLDDMDYNLPELIPRQHVLGPGLDHFDENGVPQKPQSSCHAISKVFSGSALDLNSMNPDEEDETPEHSTPSAPGSEQTLSTILEKINEEAERQRALTDRSKTTVLVVGGAGFLGSHIVSKLLDSGYTVRATVSSTAQVRELFTGVADGHRLTVAEVNMRNCVAFKDIMKGCQFVIHCGVPNVGINDNLLEVHTNTVKALFDAVRMYGKPTVKRVILTSNAVSVCSQRTPPLANGQPFDESFWNDKTTEPADPFVTAKVHFEKEAWRLRELHDIPLCVLLPSIIIGPIFTQEVSEAMGLLQGLASQNPWFPFAPDMVWNFVDVRDAAEAHIRALEAPGADSQRYLISGHMASLADLGRLIRKTHPHLPAPYRKAPTWVTLILGPLNSKVSFKYLWRNLGQRRYLNTGKAARELGFNPQPLEVTVRDAISELIASGHLPSANNVEAVSSSNTPLIVGTLVVLAAVGTFLARTKWIRK